MTFTTFISLLYIVAVVFAQERCDAPYPNVYCNTTEILTYRSNACTGYHIFIARGSDEPYPGRLGNITRQICSSMGGNDCGFESIDFPAKSTAWGKDEWCRSAGMGVANGQAQMKSYSQKCPSSKLILLGFSQGAAVAQDILGGGGGKVFECDQAISTALDPSTSPGSNVVAAVTFGAVIRSRNQNFTIGDGVNYDGRRARTPSQLAALDRYSDRLRDYCHYGDPMCAVGSTPQDVYVHLNYFLKHNEEVVSWVVGKAKADKVEGSNGNKPSESNPSSTQASVLSSSPISSPDKSTLLKSTTPSMPTSSVKSSTEPSFRNMSPIRMSSHTNTVFKSSSPSSIIAKPAPTTSGSAIVLASTATAGTDSLVVQPTQNGNTGTSNRNIGSARIPRVSKYATILVVLSAALLPVICA